MNLHELAISAARRHPDRLAVAGPRDRLSYVELDRRADTLALRLRDNGVRRGDRVVLWTEKSAATVVATQAVLRLGAAYVPADENVPAQRVALMAADCAATAICSAGGRLDQVRALVGPAMAVLDLSGPAVRSGGSAAPAGPANGSVNEPMAPDDLAYILYTSGSTGTPKGVCISHRNARSFVDWAVDLLRPGPDDRFSGHAPLTFDLSVLDVYAALASGASVHLVPAELAYAPEQLVEFVHQRRISIWYSVPSALGLMMRDGGLLSRPAPPALRAVLFAGEPFPVNRLRDLARWSPARLVNLYGPTETNVCTFHEVCAADLERDQPVPIGVACCGDRVWAERPDGSVAGPGEHGELLVDGPTVMLGYWGRPPHVGPYRTGDLVCPRGDGSYDYVGRQDHQVKVRGHRVELGEIEATLTAHADVDDAAVIVTGTGATARLTGFVVPASGRTPGSLSLRRHLAERLPRYMIVNELSIVAELPRTPHGKVDRAVLAGRRRNSRPRQPRKGTGCSAKR